MGLIMYVNYFMKQVKNYFINTKKNLNYTYIMKKE